MTPVAKRPCSEKPFEKSKNGVASPVLSVTFVLKRTSHGRPTIAVALKRSGSEPARGCLAYSDAAGASRLNRSLPFCSAVACVYVKRAPQPLLPVYGRSSVTLAPSYQKLFPTGSLMMMLPNPGANAAQQVPDAETNVMPRFPRTAL